MCFHSELVDVTFSANYATCSITALLCGEYLVGKQFCIKVGVTNNVEDFFNMDGPAVTSRRKKDTARDWFRSSALETVLICVRATVMFVLSAVVLRGKGW